LHCFAKGHEALQIIALQIIGDILSSHHSLLAQGADVSDEQNALAKQIHKTFAKGLRAPDTAVQTTGCVALCKLMLVGALSSPDLLRQLVLAYFDPETRANPSLRQALTYFLPVYCHSRRQNAEAMARVAVGVIHNLSERANDLEEDEEMVGMSLVVAQLCDWTDPRKCVPLAGAAAGEEADSHVVLAEEVLEKILSPSCSSKSGLADSAPANEPPEEERKHYVPILGKIAISDTTPAASLHDLAATLSEALESRVANESSARNALTKLQGAVAKLLAAAGPSSQDPSAPQDEEKGPATPQDEETDPATDIPDAAEEDVVDVGDLTMLTRPDHEGTVFADYEDSDESVDVTTGLAKRYVEESLLDSLLDDEE
jgi:condensin complex subunit 3